VLIEVPEQQLLAFSTDAILEKLQQAIKMVENLLLPADTSIAHISKSCMTGVIINFNAKETANWLRIPEVGWMYSCSTLLHRSRNQAKALCGHSTKGPDYLQSRKQRAPQGDRGG
jgi:hypothetical protein